MPVADRGHQALLQAQAMAARTAAALLEDLLQEIVDDKSLTVPLTTCASLESSLRGIRASARTAELLVARLDDRRVEEIAEAAKNPGKKGADA